MYDYPKNRMVVLTAMCSLDWTGWNPTKLICMDIRVPRQYTCNYRGNDYISSCGKIKRG